MRTVYPNIRTLGILIIIVGAITFLIVSQYGLASDSSQRLSRVPIARDLNVRAKLSQDKDEKMERDKGNETEIVQKKAMDVNKNMDEMKGKGTKRQGAKTLG